ncbi:hypothetical protein K3495_g482 [Podosphaera aphanis]|nr:hypothetical protein K3495_g482 [Podosphaera aphanis]
MSPRCHQILSTLTPFLYPSFITSKSSPRFLSSLIHNKPEYTSPPAQVSSQPKFANVHLPEENSHLNPPPSDYSRTIFADRASITIFSGSGGHGCISFLREKYIDAGPPNGGDGGTGGNVYIQAVRGETSLHKLARHNILRAGRGRNGRGKTKGGERGEDVIIRVPVGTVVREIERIDPVALENDRYYSRSQENKYGTNGRPHKWSREKWLLYPAITPADVATAEFPRLPRARRSPLATMQAPAPISLDLNKPMETPLLLAAGAVGGLGNPHFVTQMVLRPKYATKGEEGLRISLELELKLLADVGFVGLPNAGKSTLLRAMTKSRARVGNWAFTTLQPNIGTVVLDNHKGRPSTYSTYKDGEPRTQFTIADIPGLVKDAHLDRGLGTTFLRHVERARVLAFVVDLNAGNAVEALKALWKEVGMYEQMKTQEINENSHIEARWNPFNSPEDALANRQETIIVHSGPSFENPMAPEKLRIACKPWFVVATKADLPDTEANFAQLRGYLERVNRRLEEHPSKQNNVWTGGVVAIPVSAINGHGTEKIVECTIGLLDD